MNDLTDQIDVSLRKGRRIDDEVRLVSHARCAGSIGTGSATRARGDGHGTGRISRQSPIRARILSAADTSP